VDAQRVVQRQRSSWPACQRLQAHRRNCSSSRCERLPGLDAAWLPGEVAALASGPLRAQDAGEGGARMTASGPGE
jgi:hypothetical protein